MISDTHLNDQHPLKKRLCKSFPFSLVLSKYRYPNNSELISKMVHGLKYQHLRYIGHLEGKEYGVIITPLLRENSISALVPVPLHWRKKLKRGFNQSFEFSRGLASVTQIPILDKIVRRVKNTRSQTRLRKEERIKNMNNAFRIAESVGDLNPTGKHHFLLVDDVATSGITVSELARTMHRSFPMSRFSVCTLAYKDY